jgi:hypothetical protein
VPDAWAAGRAVPREGVRGGDDACAKGRGEVPGQGGILTAPPVPLFTRVH